MRRSACIPAAVVACLLLCLPACDEGGQDVLAQAAPASAPPTGPEEDEEKVRKGSELFWDGLALLEDMNTMGQALAAFQEFNRLFPEEAAGYVNAAVAILRGAPTKIDPEALARRALQIEPENAYAWGVIGVVAFKRRDSKAAMESLGKAVRWAPNEPKFRYLMADSLRLKLRPSLETQKRRAEELRALARLVPGNIKVRLELADVLQAVGDVDGAHRELLALKDVAAVLEEAQRAQYELALAAPGLLEDAREALEEAKAGGADAETVEKLERAVDDARGGVRAGILRFHHVMQRSPTYKMHVRQVKHTGGFSGVRQAAPSAALMGKIPVATPPPPIEVKFTAEAPIREGVSAFCLIDADGDGDDDLYVAAEAGEVLRNDEGSFTDPFGGFEIAGRGVESCAAFDLEEDTDLDLILVDGEGLSVFRNALTDVKDGKVGFRKEVLPGIGTAAKGRVAIRPIDHDHDGDLDIFLGRETGVNRVFLNRLDGIFTDVASPSRLMGDGKGQRDAIGADIEDDGDIDLVALGEEGDLVLFRNLRQGLFRPDPVAAEGGPFEAVAVVDLDNDGLLDVVAAGKDLRLLRNAGEARMEAWGSVPLAEGFAPARVAAIDYDNDGFRDLAVGGRGGLLLLRNLGSGGLEAGPAALPDPGLVTDLAVSDLDRDGDLEILLLGGGRLRVLRNDGGNAHEWLDVRFRGRDTQFGRTNHFDLGGRAEIRAGDLYQIQYVEGSVTHFGLGPRKKADIVRVVWTNGIPQSHYDIASRLDVTENVELKGSCPFLYAWRGDRFDFVTDILGGSTLGMKVDATHYAWSDNEDYIKVRGDQLRPKDGEYLLQVTEELWECIYYDEGELLVVDHPADVEIFPNEKFAPPPFPDPHIHAVGDLRPPVSARDTNGNDVLDLLRERDGRYVVDFERDRYQGMVTPHTLTLDLGDLSRAKRIRIFLNGWIYWGDTSINISISQNGSAEVRPPSLSVPDGSGGWQVAVPLLGHPVGKTKTVVHDLTGLFPAADWRVRIETNQEIYWDRILVSTQEEESPTRVTRLAPSSADLHGRGFSRLYRDGPHSPHLYDATQITRGHRWRDLEGYATRHGDVTDLVQATDDRYVILGAGDALTLRFDATTAPALPEGWRRDFLLHSYGYVKDGDLNTTHGQTVEPLPFRAMSGYPYGPDESYPDDDLHREYRETYNTRWMGQEGFRARVRSGEALRFRSPGPPR